MKQILQLLNTGVTKVADVPAPQNQPGKLLIRSTYSLLSTGTERMLVEFSQGSWLEKKLASNQIRCVKSWKKFKRMAYSLP